MPFVLACRVIACHVLFGSNFNSASNYSGTPLWPPAAAKDQRGKFAVPIPPRQGLATAVPLHPLLSSYQKSTLMNESAVLLAYLDAMSRQSSFYSALSLSWYQRLSSVFSPGDRPSLLQALAYALSLHFHSENQHYLRGPLYHHEDGIVLAGAA